MSADSPVERNDNPHLCLLTIRQKKSSIVILRKNT